MLNKKLNLEENLFDEFLLQKKATRDGLGEGLLELGEKNPDVVVLSADLRESTRADGFARKYPERFVEVGVAEQNMATVASGLANYGKIPFMTSFASFSPGRNYDQIRTAIALNNVPVKIASTHAGIETGKDGATHQMLEDISMMRTLPNIAVIEPCDFIEAKKATVASANFNMPVYLRFKRPKTPVFTTNDTPFEIGKAEIFYESESPDVLIVALGTQVYTSILAAELLKSAGLNANVINLHTIKPLDEKIILENAKSAGAVLTVEDHQVAGGMCSTISELLSRKLPLPMDFVGVRDKFGRSGETNELLEYYGLDAESIAQSAENLIKTGLTRLPPSSRPRANFTKRVLNFLKLARDRNNETGENYTNA